MMINMNHLLVYNICDLASVFVVVLGDSYEFVFCVGGCFKWSFLYFEKNIVICNK